MVVLKTGTGLKALLRWQIRLSLKGANIRVIADKFATERWKLEENRNVFEELKVNNHHPIILYSSLFSRLPQFKKSFKNEKGIETF
jgi:hypothetical protein